MVGLGPGHRQRHVRPLVTGAEGLGPAAPQVESALETSVQLAGDAPSDGELPFSPAVVARASPEVSIRIAVGDGPGTSRVLGCDLSYDYVRINGEYTT